jgi:hypothetical protein
MSSRARLRLRRSQRSSYPRMSTSVICVVEKGVNLDPEGGSFSDSGELGRLVVGEAERGHVFVLTCEVGES